MGPCEIPGRQRPNSSENSGTAPPTPRQAERAIAGSAVTDKGLSARCPLLHRSQKPCQFFPERGPPPLPRAGEGQHDEVSRGQRRHEAPDGLADHSPYPIPHDRGPHGATHDETKATAAGGPRDPKTPRADSQEPASPPQRGGKVIRPHPPRIALLRGEASHAGVSRLRPFRRRRLRTVRPPGVCIR